MTFDMEKARAICAIIDEQRDIFSPDKAAHIEVAADMFPAALDEIDRLRQNCIMQPDGSIFVPEGHPELERLREENARLRIDLERNHSQAVTLQGGYNQAVKEIERLQAENSKLQDLMLEKNHGIFQRQAARIAELEGWLIEERARQIKTTCKYDDMGSTCVGIGDGWCLKCSQKDKNRRTARQQLISEGKIGSSDHIIGANKLIGLAKYQRAAAERLA